MNEEQELTPNLLILALATTLLAFLAQYYLKKHRIYRLAEMLPGPKGLPIIGNALEFLGNSFMSLHSKFSEYEDILRLRLGARTFVFLSHPADIEVILSSHTHIDKPPEYEVLMPWFENSLLLTTGAKWRTDRKTISPIFNLNILKSFIPLFSRISEATVEKMKKEVGKVFDCHAYMIEATFEMLLESVMGISKNQPEIVNREYANAVMEMCNIVNRRQNSLFLSNDFIFSLTPTGRTQRNLLDVIHTQTKKALKIRKEDFKKNGSSISPPNYIDDEDSVESTEEKTHPQTNMDTNGKVEHENCIGGGKCPSIMDYLIEGAQECVIMTEEEIQHHVDTMMVEGLRSMASTSSFFLSLMAARPDIQYKVVEELVTIFGDSDRGVTFYDTTEMKYLERCIMETLRMYPPVPVIAREIQQETQLATRKLSLPAQCTVIVNAMKLHHRPDMYPNPEHFDPDNFLPERCASRHYYSFIPFSAGPRSCLGRKFSMLGLKVLLSTILRNYRVTDEPKEVCWKLQADRILKKTEGYKIKLEPRNLIIS